MKEFERRMEEQDEPVVAVNYSDVFPGGAGAGYGLLWQHDVTGLPAVCTIPGSIV